MAESKTYYLWSRVRHGGEVTTVTDPLGRKRKVVASRNVLMPGQKVTQKDLDATDEQWQEWIDGGVVRPYPYPKMPAGSTTSPVVFLRRQLRDVARSEEEKLVAAVTGATSTEEDLVAAAAESDKGSKE